MKALLLAALLAFGIYTVHAEVLEGRVVAVADGDTITILDASKQQHRIRINDIDAVRRHFERARPSSTSDRQVRRNLELSQVRRIRS